MIVSDCIFYFYLCYIMLVHRGTEDVGGGVGCVCVGWLYHMIQRSVSQRS